MVSPLYSRAQSAYSATATSGNPVKGEIEALFQFAAVLYPTLSAALSAGVDLPIGTVVDTGDGRYWDIVAAGSDAVDSLVVFDSTPAGTFQMKLRGPDFPVDSTIARAQALAHVPQGMAFSMGASLFTHDGTTITAVPLGGGSVPNTAATKARGDAVGASDFPFAIDADNNMLYSDGANYDYTKGQELDYFFEASQTNSTMTTTADVVRHTYTVTPKSPNSTFRIQTSALWFQDIESPGGNMDIGEHSIFVDGVEIDNSRYESDVDGATQIKSYGPTVVDYEVPSTGASMTFELRVKNFTGNYVIYCNASSMSVSEVS